jgi:hypothetical protein
MTDEPHNTDEPRNEEEFLIRESRLAREALSQMRIEALESLGRTADISAWAERYPWQSLGTAAVAGVGAGWTLGRTFRRRSSAASTVSSAQESVDNASAPQTPAAYRLASGLGTLTGAVASAAFAALAESLTEVVKSTVHDAMNPDVGTHDDVDPDDDSEPYATNDL